MGHVSTNEAFALGHMGTSMHTTQLRAHQLSTLTERIEISNTWILATLLLTAKAYLATDVVVRSLKLVCNTVLGFDSWDVTTTQLSQVGAWGKSAMLKYVTPEPRIPA